MPITVLHLVHRLTAGGAERVLVNLINNSSKHISHIVCSFSPADSFRDEIKNINCTIINLNKREGNDFRLPFNIAKICRQFKVDVVHAQGWATYAEGIIATKILCMNKTKFIFAFRGKTIEDVAKINWKRLYAQKVFSCFCDLIITPSEEMRRDYAATIRINAEKIKVIPNGINFDEHNLSLGRSTIIEFNPQEGAIVVGCVARLDPVKNLVWFVEALAPLVRKYKKLYLLIIGDGPEMIKINQEVERQKIKQKVHLAGRRNDIPVCLSAMDIYVQPSIYEGVSNTILEAMGSSLPVIATKVGGTSEIVKNNITGLLINSRNTIQLQDAVKRLMEDGDLRKQMGKDGRRLVAQQFTVQRMAIAYDKLFLSI